MTKDRARKRAVRERAASTGEKYTQARRALVGAGDGEAPPGAAAAVVEFDRQVQTLLERGYPAAAECGAREFATLLAPLRAQAAALDGGSDLEHGRFGFAIVVADALVPAATAITLVLRRERAGFLAMLNADELAAFEPIGPVSLPAGGAYLISDVDSGRGSRDRTPDDALAELGACGRSPLTIAEGIALITQFPEAVATNGGFSLAGSRCGDRRVCALWIGDGAPKLGWCWAGNPHSWLGTASCGRRLGAVAADVG